MILFKSVTYKNFLASGNNPIKIDLNNHGSTLIIGQNGAGKSTIIEALVFALFNKSFRKVNKNQLINTINEKDCVAEVEFSIGSVEWKVRRGIKPSVFEIYKNGTLLNQSSSAVDQQKWFEQSVLKLNYKSFTQIVVLGSSTFVPFMQLPAASRREIIEDLLDIRIFSTMNVILKDRVKTSTEELRSFETQISFLKEKADMQQSHIKSLEKTAKKSISQKEDKIIELQESVDNINEEITGLYQKIEKENNKLKKFDGIENKIKKLEKEITTHVNLISRTEKEQDFFKIHDKCPKCTQVLSEELKESQVSECLNIIETSKTAVDKFKSQLDKTTSILQKQANINGNVADLNWSVKSKLNDIKSSTNLIKEIKGEIETLKNDNVDIAGEKEKLSAIATQGVEVQKNIVELKKERRNYDLISTLLKDGGIKSMIIRKYLPVMNQLINKYLQALDFYVNFTLDEEFSESIKSRYRDDFTYASFSEGEKMRIDLALMFTWRSVAKLKNSANTNLLILDEVFDSSLDVAGTEDFLRIIRGIYEDTNIFVISHKGEILLDKFDRVLKFEKIKNFSRVSVS
jgi:DNA repair exonuclease SbcCD ATPase subunit|tara:strand:- start:1281 stop:2999 length:1719 start_codon:yes stop_codon:yes gene_type:complete